MSHVIPPYWPIKAFDNVPVFPRILDGVSSATFAFSIRRLRTSYLGACCRIQRVPDGAVLDVPFGENDIVNTSMIEKFCRGGRSAAVIFWYNQSGSGSFISASGTGPYLWLNNQPQLQNGIPSFFWQGTTTASLSPSGQFSNLGSGFAFYFVGRGNDKTALLAFEKARDFNTDPGGTDTYDYYPSPISFASNSFSGAVAVCISDGSQTKLTCSSFAMSAGFFQTNLSLFSFMGDSVSGSASSWFNSTFNGGMTASLLGDASISSTNSANSYSIGGVKSYTAFPGQVDVSFSGYVSELIAFRRPHEASSQSYFESNIRAFYGI